MEGRQDSELNSSNSCARYHLQQQGSAHQASRDQPRERLVCGIDLPTGIDNLGQENAALEHQKELGASMALACAEDGRDPRRDDISTGGEGNENRLLTANDADTSDCAANLVADHADSPCDGTGEPAVARACDLEIELQQANPPMSAPVNPPQRRLHRRIRSASRTKTEQLREPPCDLHPRVSRAGQSSRPATSRSSAIVSSSSATPSALAQPLPSSFRRSAGHGSP
jgi:hypothetical protein